ncbi:MAG: cation diffusion facilitator family transporter [Vicinamibacterales bacterium]
MASVGVSLALAASHIAVGIATGSTAVVATGMEFAGDVLASTVVLVGLLLAARPADDNHPYGHGRLETLAGLVVGLLLTAGGVGVSFQSLRALGATHQAPGVPALWVLCGAMVARGIMFVLKFRAGRQIGSASLLADAWNDAVDILSACTAFVAVALARFDPDRFLAADHYGGFAVGLIVMVTGLRVARDASLDLADTMPDATRMDELRAVVLRVDGVRGLEKQLGRKTGLRYHIDLHLEVDPSLTVRDGHRIAHDVKARVQHELSWVADVMVHVEPAPE